MRWRGGGGGGREEAGKYRKCEGERKCVCPFRNNDKAGFSQ